VGALTSKKITLDVPPPGLGLITVTEPAPALATSEESTVAFSRELFTNVVARGLPFQRTTAPETKPVPFTVNVNPGLPGLTVSGTSGWLMKGTGFWANTLAAITKTSRNARKILEVTTAKLLSFDITHLLVAIVLS